MQNYAINDTSVFFTKVFAPAIIFALLITTAISLSYFGLLVWLMGGVRLAKIQLMTFAPWMSLLALGFSIQLFLFFYERRFALNLAIACDMHNKQMVTNGVTTTTAMLACCVHHVLEVLPFIGLGVVGMFFGRYQILFLELGIVSNLLGILFMLTNIQKHKLYLQGAQFLFKWPNYRLLLTVAIYVSISYLLFSFLRTFA